MFGSGCSSKDQYGSNDCSLSWGSAYPLTYNVRPPAALPASGRLCLPHPAVWLSVAQLQYSLQEDLTSSAQLVLNLKVDNLLPLKATCPMCATPPALPTTVSGLF